MKITQFQVMDPLDWGVRNRPYLVVTVDDTLRDSKHRYFSERKYSLNQWGPFFEFIGSDDNAGTFNTLAPTHYSPRLIEIQLKVDHIASIRFFMDLKRARYELKKVQSTQEWSIRLDQVHAEKTGEMIYVPVKRLNNTCAWWLSAEDKRCAVKKDLTLRHTRDGLPIFLCNTHRAAETREQFARRAAAS